MKILIMCEVLDLEGTSEGIVSNSFIIKYLKSFPDHHVEVMYIRSVKRGFKNDNRNTFALQKHIFSRRKFNLFAKILNKLVNKKIYECPNIKKFKNILSNQDLSKYDNIFVRSGGLSYYLVRSLKDNCNLNKMILYFHDPYPPSIYPGSNSEFSKSEYFKIKEMRAIVQKAKTVFSPSKKLSNDLGFLFGRRFKTIPHQFDEAIFSNYKINKNEDLDDDHFYIMYHGAIQHDRNLDLVLKVFTELLVKYSSFEKFKFIIRSNGNEVNYLKKKYEYHKNIIFLKKISAYESFIEQKKYASLSIILETNGEYSNILGGKVPMLVSFNANILCITSKDSELKRLLKKSPENYSEYNFNNIEEKLKLKLDDILKGDDYSNPLQGYFLENIFKNKIESILLL